MTGIRQYARGAAWAAGDGKQHTVLCFFICRAGQGHHSQHSSRWSAAKCALCCVCARVYSHTVLDSEGRQPTHPPSWCLAWLVRRTLYICYRGSTRPRLKSVLHATHGRAHPLPGSRLPLYFSLPVPFPPATWPRRHLISQPLPSLLQQQGKKTDTLSGKPADAHAVPVAVQNPSAAAAAAAHCAILSCRAQTQVWQLSTRVSLLCVVSTCSDGRRANHRCVRTPVPQPRCFCRPQSRKQIRTQPDVSRLRALRRRTVGVEAGSGARRVGDTIQANSDR